MNNSPHLLGQLIADELARVIESEMKQRGKNIPAMSKATGIPASTLRRRLARFTSFTVADLLNVAEALGVSPGDLARSAEQSAMARFQEVTA